MSKLEPVWRIVTSEFSFVKRAPNFFKACEHALETAKTRNVSIHGVFELDALTMRRRLTRHELARVETKLNLDTNNNL